MHKGKTPIGVVGPLSGPRAAYGALLRQATIGTSLPILWQDDAAETIHALSAAHYFIENKVAAVVGHFNSECARLAGKLYQKAGIPLFLPASTADDLCLDVGAYRLCATEQQQIAAFHKFLLSHGLCVVDVWSDGSVYGDRLASGLSPMFVSSNKKTQVKVVALMGNHLNVAEEILKRGDNNTFYLVPDDCGIAEFDNLIHGSGVSVLCPHSRPDFSSGVKLALNLIMKSIDNKQDIATVMQQHPEFKDRQYRYANFILMLKYFG